MITLTIPWEPSPQVSPNSRFSTRTRRKHHDVAREIAMMATRDQMRTHDRESIPEMLAMDITWVRSKSRNRMDLDNLIACCKGIIDGVTRELGFDDRHIVALTAAQCRDASQPGSLHITIREATMKECRRAAE